MRKIIIAFILFVVSTTVALAQDTLNVNGKHYDFLKGTTDTVKSGGNSYIIKYVVAPEMADTMRSNGKIYVVVLVLATIFAGIIIYLVRLDRKISKLENN